MSSNRLAIAESLAYLLGQIQDPLTNQPIYQLVKIAMIFDPQSVNSWAAIWHLQGKVDYAGSGGNEIQWRADDGVQFIVTTGTGPYEIDSTAAEKAKLHIMDVVPSALRQHCQLPDPNALTNPLGGVYSVLLNNVDKSEKPQKFPDGHVYALWHFIVTVKQQYNTIIVSP